MLVVSGSGGGVEKLDAKQHHLLEAAWVVKDGDGAQLKVSMPGPVAVQSFRKSCQRPNVKKVSEGAEGGDTQTSNQLYSGLRT